MESKTARPKKKKTLLFLGKIKEKGVSQEKVLKRSESNNFILSRGVLFRANLVERKRGPDLPRPRNSTIKKGWTKKGT